MYLHIIMTIMTSKCDCFIFHSTPTSNHQCDNAYNYALFFLSIIIPFAFKLQILIQIQTLTEINTVKVG